MTHEEWMASARILIVDDDPSILKMCESVLRLEGYSNIRTTLDSCSVLALFVEYDPDILILDVMMPHLDGIQLASLLQRMAGETTFLPILLITAFPTADRRYKALTSGAMDILEKPYDTREFVLRVNNLLRVRLAMRDIEKQNQDLFHELSERGEELSGYQLKLKEAQLEVIARLARAGEHHDDDTGQHTQRVAVTAGMLAQGVGLSPEKVEIIGRAAPLHDVGKIGVPDSILLKPGKLTSEEFTTMQSHCQIGSDLLGGGLSEIVQMAERIALTHHERWDGTGYPNGLAGDHIPLAGRILTVADVFDALTHSRPYKTAWSVSDALEEIRRQSGRQFDPHIVDAFLQLPHAELV